MRNDEITGKTLTGSHQPSRGAAPTQVFIRKLTTEKRDSLIEEVQSGEVKWGGCCILHSSQFKYCSLQLFRPRLNPSGGPFFSRVLSLPAIEKGPLERHLTQTYSRTPVGVLQPMPPCYVIILHVRSLTKRALSKMLNCWISFSLILRFPHKQPTFKRVISITDGYF